MDKFIQRKESNTPCVLDRPYGLDEIAGFQVQNRRCQMRYRFGQAISSLDRTILLMIAGLFLSVSAFSQTPGGPTGPYTAGEQTMQFSAKQEKTPAHLPLKLIMDRMAAVQVFQPSNFEEPRRAYFLYSKFVGPPGAAFRSEDRKFPGPGGNIPIQLYTPNAQTGLPHWLFFNDTGFVAGRLDTDGVSLRAVNNRCDCPLDLVAYRLGLENRYPAAPEDAYAATKWVAVLAAEIDQNQKTPLSATPPGTFAFPPTPGSPQTPTTEAYRAGGNIDLTTLAAHFRAGLRFRRPN